MKLQCPALFLFLIILVFFRPGALQAQGYELLYHSQAPDTLLANALYKCVSWNIGYAGLGQNMDFFYDGGERTRDTEENTRENLVQIGAYLDKASEVDFILLQEVDVGSKRSYEIDQQAYIRRLMPGHKVFYAENYSSFYVPLPLSEPMGGVGSGLLLLSRHEPLKVKRHELPSGFWWPKSMFMPDRCFLSAEYLLDNGRKLVLANTHNSAFDDGSLRQDQLRVIRAFAYEHYKMGNYVVFGGDWNQSPPGYAPSGDCYDTLPPIVPIAMDSSLVPMAWLLAWDATVPTNRALNEPYSEGGTYISIIDFYMLSPTVLLEEVFTGNLRFEHSDHNPVWLVFRLEE